MSTDLPSFALLDSTRSRSISAENPHGAVGAGGQEASRLGPGRKGRPCITLPAGESVTLADIEGPGIIRHMWFTLPRSTEAGPYVLTDLAIRITWDDAERPAVEVPFGDFFCSGFGATARVYSAALVVAPNGGFNFYLPMPFRARAKIEIVNEHGADIGGFFYTINYSVGDELGDDVAYFHAQWNRSDTTAPRGTDHTLLHRVEGQGSYIGTYVALTALERFWWGEGELKFYLDGDDALPTLCGTGLEDYVGGAWGFQDHLGAVPPPQPETYTSAYLGYHQYLTEDGTAFSPYATGMPPRHGMYRWHMPDPIRFHDDIRVTLQQIGDRGGYLFERADDITSVAYFYLAAAGGVSAALPPAAQREPR